LPCPVPHIVAAALPRCAHTRYDVRMVKPPDNPEFARFTDAMRRIMRVSKSELTKRMEAEKKGKRSKVSASPGSAAASKTAN